jgi:hypothetical protein
MEILKSSIRWNVLISYKPGLKEDIVDQLKSEHVEAGLICYDSVMPKPNSLYRMCLDTEEKRIENIIFTLNENRGAQIKAAIFMKNNSRLSHIRLIAISHEPLSIQESKHFDNNLLFSGDISDLTFLLEEVIGSSTDTSLYYNAAMARKVPCTSTFEVSSYERDGFFIKSGAKLKEGEVIEPKIDLSRHFFKNKQCIVDKAEEYSHASFEYRYKLKPLFSFRDLKKEDPRESIREDDDRHPYQFKAKKAYDSWVTTNDPGTPSSCLIAAQNIITLRALSREKENVDFKTELIPDKESGFKFNFGAILKFKPSLICIVDKGMTTDEVFDIVVDIDRTAEKISGYSPNILLFSSNINRGAFVGATNRVMSVLVSDKEPTPSGLAKIIDVMKENLKSNKMSSLKRYLESKNVPVTAMNISRISPYSTCPRAEDSYSFGEFEMECVLRRINEMTCVLSFDKTDPPKNCTIDFFGLELKLTRGLHYGRDFNQTRTGIESMYFINSLSSKKKEKLRVLINQASTNEKLEAAA